MTREQVLRSVARLEAPLFDWDDAFRVYGVLVCALVCSADRRLCDLSATPLAPSCHCAFFSGMLDAGM
jgi:hypothetical protein